MNKIRVLLCDDSVDVLEGYKAYIEMTDDFECVGVVSGSEECIEEIRKKSPELLLLDIQMENEKSGIELLAKVHEVDPQVKVIMLTSYENEKYISASISGGALGYVIKNGDGFAMLDEIRGILKGNLQPTVYEALKSEVKALDTQKNSLLYMINYLVRLSPSEYEVLQDIYNGMTYKNIAKKRYVEECTINTTASRILKKFEVKNMRELIAVLKELKIFENFK